MVAGGQPVERLADRDVALVGGDHEAGVRERLRLVRDARDDAWRAVAHRGDRDARPEVDERIAVDIHEHAAAGASTYTGSIDPIAVRRPRHSGVSAVRATLGQEWM